MTGMAAGPAAGPAAFDVPYLPQTEALCGGAAVAMVFRYWGDRHADVQQFEPLVDRRAGGIADDVLVRAVRDRDWCATRLDGTMPTLRAHLDARHPVILLIQDRPTRYHYVVAVGIDDRFVYLHDPSWGPSRPFALADFERVWRASGNWSLLVEPSPERLSRKHPPAPDEDGGVNRPPTLSSSDAEQQSTAGLSADPFCEQLLEGALSDIGQRGFAAADQLLTDVHAHCPGSSRIVGELAGVRFASRRWKEAEALADESVRLDSANAYAWDVLGSSRFMQDDPHGALRAWNRLAKPRLDSVRIEGLTRTRYALVAQALGLTTNAVLSDEAYTRAERKLEQLPTRDSARLGLRPDPDGFAVVDVAFVERPIRPRGALEWIGGAAAAVVNREVSATLPGWTGQGEAWTAAVRWWAARPRAALSFTVPRVGRLPGVWRVSGFWEKETYAGNPNQLDTERTHAGIGIADWVTSQLRYEITAGVDAWRSAGRAGSIGGALERRLWADRVTLRGSAESWMPLDGSRAFHSGSGLAGFRSATDDVGFVHTMRIRADAASRSAPPSIWSGAGEGQARPSLLRAHPLLHDGVIDGPVFGRHVAHLSAESTRWSSGPSVTRMGVAVFLDVARAWSRFAGATGDPLQADAGVGFRLRVPGRDGALRVDYARGLRDGAGALTFGWGID